MIQKTKQTIRALRKFLKKSQRAPNTTGLILLYHRVQEMDSDPYDLTVSPSRFKDQLQYIKNTCNPISLSYLIEAVKSKRLPNRAVAVTFDDGYIDNLEVAYPLLESQGIPATIFVASGYIGGVKEFWWDALERILLLNKQLPNQLQLWIKNKKYDWTISSIDQQEQVHREIYQALRLLHPIEREQILEELISWGGGDSKTRTHLRPMTEAELRKLAQSGLVDIGAHSINHPVLASLPLTMQQAEIWESRDQLEKIMEKPITVFAYPYGKRNDFSNKTTNLLKLTGFQAGCTTIPGYIASGDNVFRLNRAVVKNWDIETFKYWLEEAFISSDL